MMRRFAAVLGVVSCLLFAGSANASVTMDLIWADTGTGSITLTAPSDPGATAGGDICATGFLSGAGTGRCLIVRITSSVGWTAALSSVGWSAASTGLALDAGHTLRPGFKSHGAFGGNGTTLGPAAPSFQAGAIAQCQGLDPSCDTVFGSFGGSGLSVNAAGTYTLGSINFDTSSISPASSIVLSFFRTGVGGVLNKKFAALPVQLNGASLSIIPEPGTASLLGLGIMGLVLAGRRRKN